MEKNVRRVLKIWINWRYKVSERLLERNISINESLNFQEKDPLPFTYFAVFDGHAGSGAALMAVKLLQEHIQVNILI